MTEPRFRNATKRRVIRRAVGALVAALLVLFGDAGSSSAASAVPPRPAAPRVSLATPPASSEDAEVLASGLMQRTIERPPTAAGPVTITTECTICARGSTMRVDLPGAWKSGTFTIRGPQSVRTSISAFAATTVSPTITPSLGKSAPSFLSVGRRFSVWWDPQLPPGKYVLELSGTGRTTRTEVRVLAPSQKGGPYFPDGPSGTVGGSVRLALVGRAPSTTVEVKVWSGATKAAEWRVTRSTPSVAVPIGPDGIGEVIIDLPTTASIGDYCFVALDDQRPCTVVSVAPAIVAGVAEQFTTPAFTGSPTGSLVAVGSTLILIGYLLVSVTRRRPVTSSGRISILFTAIFALTFASTAEVQSASRTAKTTKPSARKPMTATSATLAPRAIPRAVLSQKPPPISAGVLAQLSTAVLGSEIVNSELPPPTRLLTSCRICTSGGTTHFTLQHVDGNGRAPTYVQIVGAGRTFRREIVRTRETSPVALIDAFRTVASARVGVGDRFAVFWPPEIPTGQYRVTLGDDRVNPWSLSQVITVAPGFPVREGPFVRDAGNVIPGESFFVVYIGREPGSTVRTSLFYGPSIVQRRLEPFLTDTAQRYDLPVGPDGVAEFEFQTTRETGEGLYCLAVIDDASTPCVPVQVGPYQTRYEDYKRQP